MGTTNTSEHIDVHRRRLFGTAALTLAAAQFGVIGSTDAETRPAQLRAVKLGTNTSFGPLKQIDAGLLNVGYAERGTPMVPRSSFCTAGPTTFTALSTSHLCWRRRATV